MLDVEFIRAHKKLVADSAKHKNIDVDIDQLLKLDEQRSQLITKIDDLRAKRNQMAKQITGKPSAADLKAGKQLRTNIGQEETKLTKIEPKFLELAQQVPNVLHKSVPIGKDDSGNEVVRKVGEIPKFDFKAKDHIELGEALDLIDTETASRTSGSRYYYLKNGAVQLEFALIQWLLTKYIAKGFTPVITPQLVREQMMYATGFFPADKNEIYHVNPAEDDLYLIGTSEVTLAGLHMFKPIDAKALPKRYIGFSTCFRREAGSYGKDVKGIFRVHQFDKLEMYSYVHPDKSWEEHEYLLSIEEEILGELKLPYQVVNICSGDLGAPAAKKYDLEAWIPSQQRYRELTSCSNTTDFQSRRGGMRFKDGGFTGYVHTLNGTAMASTRTIIAIMENNQTKDGRVKIPTVLKGYLDREFL